MTRPSSFGERERFNPGPITDLTTLLYRVQFQNADTSFYSEHSYAYDNDQDIMLAEEVQNAFWLVGAQMMLEVPHRLSSGKFKVWFSRSLIPTSGSLVAAGINPIAQLRGARDFVMIGAAGIGKSFGGESNGRPVEIANFSPAPGCGMLFKKGDVLCLFSQYDYVMTTDNAPSDGKSNAFVHLLLHTVPYVDYGG